MNKLLPLSGTHDIMYISEVEVQTEQREVIMLQPSFTFSAKYDSLQVQGRKERSKNTRKQGSKSGYKKVKMDGLLL